MATLERSPTEVRPEDRIVRQDTPSAIDRIDPPVIEQDQMQAQPREGRDDPTITGDTARQGPAGYRVLYVLAFGIVGAAVAMAIAYSFFAGATP